MKKITKLFTVFLIMLFAVPVFAEDGVTVENIIGTTLNENVVLNATDKIDVAFNDLKQDASYKITLKNNTDEVVYVNDVLAENLSEEFIEFSLTNKSLNTMIEPGKENVVEVEVKTLDITHAGRNVNEEVTLKFLLGDSVVNPETSANWIVYVILVGTLLITISTMFSKLDKMKKISIFVIGTLVLGTTVVSANDNNTLSLSVKVKYTSQNLLQEAGIKLDDYRVSYVNSLDVWKYADQVKNIIISDDMTQPNEYDHKYDLTIDNSKKIYGYLVKNGNSKTPYDLYIVSNGVIYAPENSTGLFSFPNVETIKGLEYVEFDNTTNMSAMFLGDVLLKEGNFKSINFENVEDATCMFKETPITIGHINAEYIDNIKYKDYMFGIDLYDLVKDGSTSDFDTDFKLSPVAGKYYIEETKNEMNPIYYYRGNVTNNNVIFADFCWQIVRTTETGGIKLIYNGIPGENNVCQSPGENSNIGLSKYNLDSASPSYVGYMYGVEYVSKDKLPSEIPEKCIYGNDVEWDGSKYVLKDTFTSNSFSNDMNQIKQKYHYTCFNDSGQCSKVYYINSYITSKLYYLTLKNGENIEDAKEEFNKNLYDSEIKKTVDNWYKNNLNSYTNKLEDTVWCNDRTFANGSLKSKDTEGGRMSNYESVLRNNSMYEPNVSCSNLNDSFTVSETIGNGKLTYPVGLLTADEMTLAGFTSYLNAGTKWWTMTPHYFYYDACIVYQSANGTYTFGSAKNGSDRYVRPSISLKHDSLILKGLGTFEYPYIIK
ncbi:MAG: hypothetical protein J6C28_07295 [Bacilli bacterium]|nr:hypothetical protein [Bacilli bacterium]